MGEHRELERKLRTPAAWSAADIAALPGLAAAGIVSAEERPPMHLDAVYHDTADLRLVRSGATLRRRTGGDDAGWHLKLPAPDGSRTELHRPLREDADPLDDPPPASLRALVIGLSGGRPLVPVARLGTTRVPVELRDADGTTVVELARDDVVATTLGDDPRTRAWSELEAELVSGPDALLDAVAEALVAAGAEIAPAGPKIVVAFGPEAVEPVLPPVTGASSPLATAGAVVTAYVRDQVRALVALDPDVRRDVPDSVHQSRVATRRLRSVLAAFRPLLDTDVTEPIRDELRWWGQVLGAARDAEVRRAHLADAIDVLPRAMVVGDVREALVDGADAEYREAWSRAVEQASGERYLALLARLEDLALRPPLRGAADAPADRVLPPLVRRQWKRVKRIHRAAAAAPEAHRVERLHELRKAAKRARYTSEAVAPVVGHRAARMARRLDDLQDALGAANDAELMGAKVRRQAAHAHRGGVDAFTYGALAQVESARAQEARERYRDAWARASRRRVHEWTRG